MQGWWQPNFLFQHINSFTFFRAIIFSLASVIVMINFDGCFDPCQNTIYTYVAGEYLAGSAFYFIGGALNTVRVYIIDKVLHLHRAKIGKVPKIEVVHLGDSTIEIMQPQNIVKIDHPPVKPKTTAKSHMTPEKKKSDENSLPELNSISVMEEYFHYTPEQLQELKQKQFEEQHQVIGSGQNQQEP